MYICTECLDSSKYVFYCLNATVLCHVSYNLALILWTFMNETLSDIDFLTHLFNLEHFLRLNQKHQLLWQWVTVSQILTRLIF